MHKPILFIGILIVLLMSLQFGQNNQNADHSAPVVLDGDTLFYVYANLGTFSKIQRANQIGENLIKIARSSNYSIDSINFVKYEGFTEIVIEDKIILSLSTKDVEPLGISVDSAASKYLSIIKTGLKTYRTKYSTASLIENSIISAVIFIALIIFLFLMRLLFRHIYKRIISLTQTHFSDIVIKGKTILTPQTIGKLLIFIHSFIRVIITLGLIYYAISYILDIFPYTSNLEIIPSLRGILILIFYCYSLFYLLKGISLLKNYLFNRIAHLHDEQVIPTGFKGVQLITPERLTELIIFSSKAGIIFVRLVLVFTFLALTFRLFPFTYEWGDSLLNFVLTPIYFAFNSFVNFLPNLFFIIVLIAVFYYLTKFIAFIFREIDSETISFPGFHKEWAEPTYKIVRFLIIVLAAIVIFPYLPGSNSPFFQGISVFLGVLFSLGSSSAIANIVSGVVLTYMRPFKIGDRIKIADTVGDVIEKTLLVTRIRTPKNVDVSIPNAMVLGSHIINYSASALDKGLILSTSVTIGYDVPWKQVHELLISAATETRGILSDPYPFVFQTSLEDFYVAYELNAYTNLPNSMAGLYSELHSKIQDKFNEAGVEIMSPHYNAHRDGNQTTIPANYLPKDYAPPLFNIGLRQSWMNNKAK